jgi:hypothetical protein
VLLSWISIGFLAGEFLIDSIGRVIHSFYVREIKEVWSGKGLNSWDISTIERMEILE